jgi:hypothetical protein
MNAHERAKRLPDAVGVYVKVVKIFDKYYREIYAGCDDWWYYQGQVEIDAEQAARELGQKS